jgi:hypothetical protein
LNINVSLIKSLFLNKIEFLLDFARFESFYLIIDDNTQESLMKNLLKKIAERKKKLRIEFKFSMGNLE